MAEKKSRAVSYNGKDICDVIIDDEICSISYDDNIVMVREGGGLRVVGCEGPRQGTSSGTPPAPPNSGNTSGGGWIGNDCGHGYTQEWNIVEEVWECLDDEVMSRKPDDCLDGFAPYYVKAEDDWFCAPESLPPTSGAGGSGGIGSVITTTYWADVRAGMDTTDVDQIIQERAWRVQVSGSEGIITTLINPGITAWRNNDGVVMVRLTWTEVPGAARFGYMLTGTDTTGPMAGRMWIYIGFIQSTTGVVPSPMTITALQNPINDVDID